MCRVALKCCNILKWYTKVQADLSENFMPLFIFHFRNIPSVFFFNPRMINLPIFLWIYPVHFEKTPLYPWIFFPIPLLFIPSCGTIFGILVIEFFPILKIPFSHFFVPSWTHCRISRTKSKRICSEASRKGEANFQYKLRKPCWKSSLYFI